MASKNKSESKAAQRAERLAELQAQQKAQARRRNLMIGGVVAVVVVLIAAVVVAGVLGGNDANEDLDATAAVAPSDYSVVIGPEDAPHQVVVYEDFLCPACGALEAATNEELAQLAADGEVRVDYRPFTLLSRFGPYSEDAVNAFGAVKEVAGDEVAKAFHDELYADQPGESDSEFPGTDFFVEKAVAAGADEAEVRAAIEGADGSFEQGATSDAQAAGVTGTPTILVDGESFVPENSWDELLDAVRE